MTFLRSLCVCAAAAALWTGPATAANTSSAAKAYVPFEFVVSGKTMPAGTYIISTPDAAGVLSVRAERGNTTALAVGTRVSSPISRPGPQLVFVRKGGKLHLSQVLPQFSQGGAELSVK